MVNELPIYKIRNKFYYRDIRLNEYRNIKDINDKIDINEVNLSDLQTPTLQDRKKIWNKPKKKPTKKKIALTDKNYTTSKGINIAKRSIPACCIIQGHNIICNNPHCNLDKCQFR